MMCLAVPARLVSRDQDQGVVDLNGNRIQVSTILVPEVQPGDWVLVHAGFALQTLEEEDAAQTWRILEGMGAMEPAPGGERGLAP
jgi:hydrogenase expression/formation protein HypC